MDSIALRMVISVSAISGAYLVSAANINITPAKKRHGLLGFGESKETFFPKPFAMPSGNASWKQRNYIQMNCRVLAVMLPIFAAKKSNAIWEKQKN